MANDTRADRLLTFTEVAERLSVSPATVGRYVARGELRSHKLGNRPTSRRRVAESDLQAFIARTRQ